MKFIIEHLEKELYKWCLIEYKNISKIIGKNNLMFTNIKSKKDFKILKRLGAVKNESVTKLKLKNTCLLDPKATKCLQPTESFDYYIFGGILGDYPEQGRTEKYLTKKLKNAELRNLNNMQMSTDTAVLVTKKITTGTPIERINFIDKPVIILKKGIIKEEIELPFRYVSKNNKPQISPKLLKYLKNKRDL